MQYHAVNRSSGIHDPILRRMRRCCAPDPTRAAQEQILAFRHLIPLQEIVESQSRLAGDSGKRRKTAPAPAKETRTLGPVHSNRELWHK